MAYTKQNFTDGQVLTAAKLNHMENGIAEVEKQQGPPGKDGVSPTVAVTSITDGHRVTITDATGQKSFDVLNGKNATGGGGSSGVSDSFPVGGIIIWSGTADDIPSGWHICDGTQGTPDLRDRFVLGAGTAYEVGSTGGAAKVTLTTAQMPSHIHASGYIASVNGIGDIVGYLPKNKSDGVESNSVWEKKNASSGYSEAHENMPPYYALCYIMKLSDSTVDLEAMSKTDLLTYAAENRVQGISTAMRKDDIIDAIRKQLTV